jgi:oligopeptide transport system permease protein
VLFVCWLVAIAGLTVLAPWLVPYHPNAQVISERLLAPSSTHWLGTDALGRDLWSRILFGGRSSVSVGLISAFFSLALGTFTGAVAGYYRGWVDRIVLAMIDYLSLFPSLLLAILFSLLFGRGLLGVIFSIGLVAWVQQARLVRTLVIQAQTEAYVEAARSLGLAPSHILFQHVLRNLWGPILVSVSAQVPTNIMSESFLSFLGLGLQPPLASWGTLAAEGARALRSHLGLLVFPSLALFLTLLACQYLGDWLRDQLAVHSRQS